MALQTLLSRLGPEVEDAYEETFDLFSSKPASQNLGFVDRSATSIDLSIAGTDITVHQSPTLLNSNLTGGTTGAVLWKVTPAVASWICDPSNLFFTSSLLSRSSTVLELGAGISGVLALTLGTRVGRYLHSDQPYVLKHAQKNLDEGLLRLSALKTPRKLRKGGGNKARTFDISCIPLDWESDSLSQHPAFCNKPSPSIVIACDCVYNEALVQPLVDTCADACRISNDELPTIVLFAQELRSSDVFEHWLEAFHSTFHTYRIPDAYLSEELKPTSGFAVHVGVLK